MIESFYPYDDPDPDNNGYFQVLTKAIIDDF